MSDNHNEAPVAEQETEAPPVREASAPDPLDGLGNVELELRGRITALEAWRDRAEPYLGMVATALVAMALAGLGVTLVLRRRLSV